MSDRITKASLPGRIHRLKELAGQLCGESMRAVQERNPLKPDEIKAYSAAMLRAFSALEEARAVLEGANERLSR